MTPHRIRGIKGLTDTLWIPRKGRVRKGDKKIAKSGNEFPDEWDHYNFCDAPLLGEAYGDNCRVIDIMFAVNDPAEVLDVAYMRWSKDRTWKCRGDGVIAWSRDADDEIECLGEECQAYKDEECTRQARLEFICYKAPGGLAVHDIYTTGRRDIQNLVGGIAIIESLFGRIDGIPLKLHLEPYQAAYVDDAGKKHTTNHYALRLDTELSLLEVKRLNLGGGKEMVLESPSKELPEDHFPKSLQEGAREVEAVEPAEEAAEEEKLEIPGEVLDGFNILGLAGEVREQLIMIFEGDWGKLLAHLNLKVDAKQSPAPAKKAKTPKKKPPAKKSNKATEAFF